MRRLCGADLKDWNGRCWSNARECIQAIRSRERVDRWPYLENNGRGHHVARAACRRCRDNPCHVALGASIDQPASVPIISVRLAGIGPPNRTGLRCWRCCQCGGPKSLLVFRDGPRIGSARFAGGGDHAQACPLVELVPDSISSGCIGAEFEKAPEVVCGRLKLPVVRIGRP